MSHLPTGDKVAEKSTTVPGETKEVIKDHFGGETTVTKGPTDRVKRIQDGNTTR